MIDIIIIAIILCVAAAAVLYIYKAKKRGQSCIGCPYSKQCGNRNCGGCCGTSRK